MLHNLQAGLLRHDPLYYPAEGVGAVHCSTLDTLMEPFPGGFMCLLFP